MNTPKPLALALIIGGIFAQIAMAATGPDNPNWRKATIAGWIVGGVAGGVVGAALRNEREQS